MERVVDDSFFKFKKPLSPANPGNEKTSRLNLSISTCSLTVFFFESANIALRIRWRMNFRNEFSGGSIEEKRERNIGEEFSACFAKKVNSGE